MFRTSANVGVDVPSTSCAREFDAIVLAGGVDRAARSAGARPRADGHPLRDGVPDAAEPPLRRRRRSPTTSSSPPKDKHVVIIGGGDTGADCLGTAHRQGARSVHQLELLPRPPDDARGGQPVAAVAEHLPRLVGARRGRRAPLLDLDAALHRRRRRAASRRCTRVNVELVQRERPAVVRAGARQRVRARRRPRAAGDGVPRPGAQRHARRARREA